MKFSVAIALPPLMREFNTGYREHGVAVRFMEIAGDSKHCLRSGHQTP